VVLGISARQRTLALGQRRAAVLRVAAGPDIDPVAGARRARVLEPQILLQVGRVDDGAVREAASLGGHGERVVVRASAAGDAVATAAVHRDLWAGRGVVGVAVKGHLEVWCFLAAGGKGGRRERGQDGGEMGTHGGGGGRLDEAKMN